MVLAVGLTLPPLEEFVADGHSSPLLLDTSVEQGGCQGGVLTFRKLQHGSRLPTIKIGTFIRDAATIRCGAELCRHAEYPPACSPSHTGSGIRMGIRVYTKAPDCW